MIFYLANRTRVIQEGYLWRPEGKPLASQVSVLGYDELWHLEQFTAGTYIFTDLERLSDRERQHAAEVWDRLEQSALETRMLNNPHRVLGRYELLRTLRANGTNRWTAYRLHEAADARFPVFVRREHEHSGSLTRLLWSRAEVARAVAWLWQRGEPLHDLLVVEFCDTAERHGAYSKYGAYVVGKRIIPRSMAFDVNWVVKPGKAPPPSAAQLRVEAEYVETNPHREWLAGLADLAAVDYGRIDYSMDDGRPVVWEINTNPWYGLRKKLRPPERIRLVQQVFVEQLEAAWRDLDVLSRGDGNQTYRISLPPEPPPRRPVRWWRSVCVAVPHLQRRVAERRSGGHSRVMAMLLRIVLPLMWRLDRRKLARGDFTRRGRRIVALVKPLARLGRSSPVAETAQRARSASTVALDGSLASARAWEEPSRGAGRFR